MNGFKTWIEDFERKVADPDRTVDWQAKDRAKDQTPLPNRNLSQHAWDKTPDYGKDATVAYQPPSTKPTDDLVGQISMIISPDARGKSGVDSTLHQRRKDGKHYASFQGTPTYAAPEELKKMRDPELSYEQDEVERLLSMCADLFIWLERPCLDLKKKWLQFRSFLHPLDETHVVMYQTNIMRMKDCEKIFPEVEKVVRASKNSDRYADLIKAWNAFYAGWNDVAPTLKHYLVTFEKNTQKR